MEPHRDKAGALEDRVGALEDWSPQETRLEPILEIGLEPQIDKVGALEIPSRCLAQYRLNPRILESSSRVGALYYYCTRFIVKKILIKTFTLIVHFVF